MTPDEMEAYYQSVNNFKTSPYPEKKQMTIRERFHAWLKATAPSCRIGEADRISLVEMIEAAVAEERERCANILILENDRHKSKGNRYAARAIEPLIQMIQNPEETT